LEEIRSSTSGTARRAAPASIRPSVGSGDAIAGRPGSRTNGCFTVGRVPLNIDISGGEAADLQGRMGAMIAGQDEAIKEIVNIYQLHLAGLTPQNRPIGTFLFLGPTGTGKTRTVEALAESLTGTSRAVVKIDCAEFQHSHEIAKLVGSPPGYLGHRETHPLLSQETLSQYHNDRMKLSFVLFDEIEKASDALWNLLLGILDKATLTLGDNRRVDFSNTMIFLTSNLGAREMGSIINPGLGFQAAPGQAPDLQSAPVLAQIKRAATEAARRKFTPEFINRLDKITVFSPLGEDDLRRIVKIELGRLQDRILTCSASGGFVLRVTEPSEALLLSEGVDARYGARHLRRVIERRIVQPLANLISSGQVRMGDVVEVDCGESAEQLNFSLIAQGLTMQEMSEAAGPSVQPLLQLAAALGKSKIPDLASIS
jgi:ATP-dependent Clp protease ATP-binding subunit ClpA